MKAFSACCLQSPINEFTFRTAITGVQTSPNVDISRYSNGYILVVREATVMWLGMLVVLHVLFLLFLTGYW